MSEFVININDAELQVRILNDNKVSINNSELSYEVIELKKSSYILKLNDKQYQIDLLEKNKESYQLLINNIQINSTAMSSLEHRAMKLIEQGS